MIRIATYPASVNIQHTLRDRAHVGGTIAAGSVVKIEIDQRPEAELPRRRARHGQRRDLCPAGQRQPRYYDQRNDRRDRPDQQNDRSCYVCKKTGHMSWQCPEKKKAEEEEIMYNVQLHVISMHTYDVRCKM